MKFNTHINRRIERISLPEYLFLFATILISFSCDPQSTEPVDSYKYFPLEVGRFLIYDVKEEIYSAGQQPVVKTWQERDEIEKMTVSQGIEVYTFSRSIRNTTTDFWQKSKEFTVKKYPDRLLTTIDNVTLFSLAFPIDPNVEWNGNSFNISDPQDFHYEDLNEQQQVGSNSFSNVVTVVERRDTSIINRYVGFKQYALGVGLIMDDQTALEYCQTEDCIGSGQIESGSIKTRKIIEFGAR